MPWVTTTVFSTPCSRSRPASGRFRPALLILLLLFTALFLRPAAAESHDASVTSLRLEQADDGLYLTAQVDFELPPVVSEVLEKGIAIYFVAEAELYRERWYWTDLQVAQAARYMRLVYQPLTRRWRLNVSPTPITNAGFGVTLNQNFDSLDEALEAVRRIGRLRLGDVAEIGDAPIHQVNFQFKLDTSQLPRPFQIGAVGQSGWNISADKSAKLPVEKSK